MFEEVPHLLAIVMIVSVLTTEPQIALEVDHHRYIAREVQPMFLLELTNVLPSQ